jgi:hypothetical protein
MSDPHTFSGYFVRGSTSSSAKTLCTAAVDLLHKSPPPLPPACAFGLQLIACCLGDSGNYSCCTVSLSQAIFLINVCSSFIAQPPHAEDQTSERNLNSSAPSLYPLVLPLPGQRIAPLPVAAAAGVAFVFLLMLDMLVVRMATTAAFCECLRDSCLQLWRLCSNCQFYQRSYKIILNQHRHWCREKKLFLHSLLLHALLGSNFRFFSVRHVFHEV